MNSELLPGGPDPVAAREQAGGCAWMLIWTAVAALASGTVLIGGLLLSPHASGYAGLLAFAAVGLGVIGAAIAAILAVLDRAIRRTAPTWRLLAGVAALAAGAALLWPGIAVTLLGGRFPFDTGLPTVAGVTVVVLSLVFASGLIERRASLVLAATWVVLWGSIGYRDWTDMDAAVVWLGRGSDGRAQIAFVASRSADYEVRFGAPSCGEGGVFTRGRYDWAPDRAGIGRALWIDLPADLLPLKRGDLVRVCLRDGFAFATAAGEAGAPEAGPSSFWPRD